MQNDDIQDTCKVLNRESGTSRGYSSVRTCISAYTRVQVCFSIWMRGCTCLHVYATWSCEIDATACSTSLTEESSGMEMDHMVTVTMVPDALALEKGIG